jgi:hypothetical protein
VSDVMEGTDDASLNHDIEAEFLDTLANL